MYDPSWPLIREPCIKPQNIHSSSSLSVCRDDHKELFPHDCSTSFRLVGSLRWLLPTTVVAAEWNRRDSPSQSLTLTQTSLSQSPAWVSPIPSLSACHFVLEDFVTICIQMTVYLRSWLTCEPDVWQIWIRNVFAKGVPQLVSANCERSDRT